MSKKNDLFPVTEKFANHLEEVLSSSYSTDEEKAYALLSKGEIGSAKIILTHLYDEGICYLVTNSYAPEEIKWHWNDPSFCLEFQQAGYALRMGIWLAILGGDSQRISDHFCKTVQKCQKWMDNPQNIDLDGKLSEIRICFYSLYGYALFALGSYEMANNLLSIVHSVCSEHSQKGKGLNIPLYGAISRLLLPLSESLVKGIIPDNSMLNAAEKDFLRGLSNLEDRHRGIIYLYYFREYLKKNISFQVKGITLQQKENPVFSQESFLNTCQAFLATDNLHCINLLGCFKDISTFSDWCNTQGDYPILQSLPNLCREKEMILPAAIQDEVQRILSLDGIPYHHLITAEKINSASQYTLSNGLPLYSCLTGDTYPRNIPETKESLEETARRIASRINPDYSTVNEEDVLVRLSQLGRPGYQVLFSLIRDGPERLRINAMNKVRYNEDPAFFPDFFDLFAHENPVIAQESERAIRSLIEKNWKDKPRSFSFYGDIGNSRQNREKLLELLRSALNHQNEQVRIHAIRCIRDISDPVLHDMLVDVYNDSSNSENNDGKLHGILKKNLPLGIKVPSPVRWEAAISLASLGDGRGCEEIAAGPSSYKREQVLATLGDKRAIPYVLSQLASWPHELNQWIAAIGEDIIEPLIDFTYNGVIDDRFKTPQEYRLSAARILLSVSSSRLIPYYTGLLTHPSTDFQMIGIKGLAKEKPPGYREEIRKKLTSVDDNLVLSAAILLCACGDPEGEDILKNALNTVEPKFRYVRVCDRMDELLESGPAGYQVIKWLFSQKPAKWWFFQRRLFDGLRKRGDPFLMDAVKGLLNSSKREARSEGLYILLISQISQGIDSLISFLKKAQREEIPGILAKLAESDDILRTVPIAISYTSAEETDIRKAAANLLRKAGDSSACKTLVTMLADPNISIRYAALQALETCGDGSISPILIHLMSDRDPRIRIAAVRALASERSDSSFREIANVIRDQNPAVRAAVIESLSVITPDTGTAELITPFLNDSSWQVRISTVQALSRVGRKEDIASLDMIIHQDPAYDDEGVSIRKIASNVREKILADAELNS